MIAGNFSGQSFGRWTVIKRVANRANGHAQWLCRCECGTKRILRAIIVKRSLAGEKGSCCSYSCGCLRNELTIVRSTKHNHAHEGATSPTYWSWSGMVARCTNPDHSSFMRYGGRGVSIYEPWLVFANFLADMGERPTGTSLDRIDNGGIYEPSNCRWATPKQQARNKRSNRMLTFNGETATISAWAEKLGINQTTLSERLEKWSLSNALTTPKLTGGRPLKGRNRR